LGNSIEYPQANERISTTSSELRIMPTKEQFELVINLAQEKLNDINEEETFELNGKEVSVVSAMEALANVWDYKCDLIRGGLYYGS
jgi:hypothetical protein